MRTAMKQVLTAFVLYSIAGVSGSRETAHAVPQSTGAEDFAAYSQKVPGCFVRLGVRNESQGAVYGLHSPQFKIDEAALPLGVRAHVLFAVDFLSANPSAPH